jgi:lysophospholipase L1-like esterase
MNPPRINLLLPLLALCCTTFFLSSAPAQQTEPVTPPPTPAVKPAKQEPDVAAPKVEPDGTPQARFIASHEKFLTLAKEGKARLVFLGDSITAGWAKNPEIWNNHFGKHDPVNFGIGGDRTQHVLWRLENGELDGIQPKLLVLMIGTNNIGGDSAEGITRGITKIVEFIHTKSPGTRILLLGIFPRGEKTVRGQPPAKLKEINSALATMDNGSTIHFLDIGDRFFESDGTLSKEVMPDFLHLSPKGYQIWAEAISQKVDELMQ